MYISIQSEDFEVDKICNDLYLRNESVGALVNFVGYVRRNYDYNKASVNYMSGDNQKDKITGLRIEYYEKMTKRVIFNIAKQALKAHNALDCSIVHRFGDLLAGEKIVLVAVVARHRQSSFLAAKQIIDEIKNKAPFWKFENYENNQSRWLKPEA